MLPAFLKPNFWFVKFDELDKEKNKEHIIFQILDRGRFEDWQWLFNNYPTSDIRETVGKSLVTAWSKNSISLWEQVLGVKARMTRFSKI